MQDRRKAPLNATSPQLEAFLAYMSRERRLADNSLTTYKYAVQSYLAHLSGLAIGPDQATEEVILAYLEERKRQGQRSYPQISGLAK